MKCILPAQGKQTYWNVHYRYFYNIIKTACEVEYVKGLDINQTSFRVCLDGQWCIIDFSNASLGRSDPKGNPVFKFQYKLADDRRDKVYPFLKVCFYDWEIDLKRDFNYQAKGERILNCQRTSRIEFKARRLALHKLLKDYDVDYELTEQEVYWNKIPGCLTSVHVPGNNNNILDRAQLQFMAFGVCTISPNLPEILPYGITLIPGEHYVRCRNDYTDLTDCVEWVRANRKEAVQIGKQARELFMGNFTPDKLVAWLKDCIGR